MRLQDLFQMSGRSIRTGGIRSVLTMLGIVIGIASVVLMASIGESMQGLILGQISVLGNRSMIIFPGTNHGGGPNPAGTTLTMGDLEALSKLQTITAIAPGIFLTGNVRAGAEEADVQVTGVRPAYLLNQNISPARGRLLDDSDEQSARLVAFIGPDVTQKLFLNQNPLGRKITVGRASVTVVGEFASVGSQFFQNFDERIFVPFSTAKVLSGQKYVNFINMQATGDFDLAFADVRALLRQRHGIFNPEDDADKDDFVVRSAAQAQEILGTVSLALTAFITIIAAISLVVGGIGIMNIMLVSVTERTREIGLRKALGATRRDVLTQFLLEAVLLTLLGGVVGTCLGIFGAFLVALGVRPFLNTYVFALSVPALVLALSMAAATGLLFGIAPARRAANLSPMEALRYE